MQRRAAAAYVVFFLVLAAGAYAMIALTEAPEVTVENPDHDLAVGDEVTVDGRTYAVSELTAERASGGGHGGGGGIERSATFEWTNESKVYTESWTANETTLENATVSAEGGSATIEFTDPLTRNFTFAEESVNASSRGSTNDSVSVTFENGTTSEFLVEEGAFVTGTELAANNSTVVASYFPADVRTYTVLAPDNSTLVLRQQPDVETITRDGRLFVLVDRNDDGVDEAVPIEDYEELERVRITTGDDLQYRGNSTDLSIANESVTLRWTHPTVETVDLSDRANVTLNGQRFFAFFPDNNTVYLKSADDLGSYRETVEASREYHERKNGFWGVTLISILASIFLAGLAFLPRKEV